MFTLVFLVCDFISGQCYSATAGVVYPTERSCEREALAIIERNLKLSEEEKTPPETATYLCINWGQPA